MSIDKLPVFEEFPAEKGQSKIVFWIKTKIFAPISRRINFLLSLVNSGFVEIPADDVDPGTDGNWRWRVDSSGDLVLQRLVSGTWTDTAIKMFTTGITRIGDVDGSNYTDITATGDIHPVGSAFLVFEKASGNGIKVDQATPTFGFADLLGEVTTRNTGATKPSFTTYNGAIDQFQFTDGDEEHFEFHIPHDYVLGTDIHLHIHWSQTSTTNTGGTIDFKYFAVYGKGHNQASGSAFTGTPITATFTSVDLSGGSGGTQFQHHLTEVTISAATATAALFDRDDLEPDGVILLTLEMDTNNLTDSVAVLDPFIHYADIHYQTNSIVGTKSRTPDFYT